MEGKYHKIIMLELETLIGPNQTLSEKVACFPGSQLITFG